MHKIREVRNKLTILTLVKLTESLRSPPNKKIYQLANVQS